LRRLFRIAVLGGGGDFFALGREGDVADGLGCGIVERTVGEVDFAGAQQAVEAIGGLDVDSAGVEGGDDDGVVDVEGGAVLGDDEREGLAVPSVGIGDGDDLGKLGFDHLMMTAIEAFTDRGLSATAP
jgi:hypothetical protein